MAISSDEVNFLVYRYLQENGFSHAAFTFAYESDVLKNDIIGYDIPPGTLITFLQKGLQYVGMEAHIREDGTEQPCDAELSLVNPHICRIAQSGVNNKARKKRKIEDNEISKTSTSSSPNSITRKDSVIDRKKNKDLINGADSSVAVSKGITLLGHKSEVFVCCWNPKANQIASGSGDSTVRIWDIPDDIDIHQKAPQASHILQHTTPSQVNKDVTTIEWNYGGSLLATGSYDGQTRIWTNKGELQFRMESHQGPVFSLKWNKMDTFLLSASYDRTVALWDISKGGVKKQSFNVHSGPILDIAWKNEFSFASCSSDRTIKLCNISSTEDPTLSSLTASGTSSVTRTFIGHKDEVNTIKWEPSANLLASCSDDYTVKIWDSSSNDDNGCVSDFTDHKKEVYTIRWSPTGPETENPNKDLILASASFDRTIKLWDIHQSKCINTFSHSDPVYAIGFSPNGDYLASGALNGVIHIWSIKEKKMIRTYCGIGDIYEIEWNYRGDALTACFSSGSLMVIDFRV